MDAIVFKFLRILLIYIYFLVIIFDSDAEMNKPKGFNFYYLI